MASARIKKLSEVDTPNYLKDWQLDRHRAAACRERGTFPEADQERAMVTLADAIAGYINAMYAAMPEGDHAAIQWGIGPMLDGWKYLLSHPRGRLDGGAASSWAEYAQEMIGYDPDGDTGAVITRKATAEELTAAAPLGLRPDQLPAYDAAVTAMAKEEGCEPGCDCPPRQEES
jgi:hypothetical protein